MSQIPFNPFAGSDILLTFPATGPQQEIWLAIRLGGREANLAYNESLSLELHGRIDAAALSRAVQMLVERHEALRSTFTPDGDFVTVLGGVDADVRVEDLRSLSEAERSERKRELIRREMTTEFDLVLGPLFRARLVQLEDERLELVIIAHHLVCDGWSSGVIMSELPELYRAALAGEAASLEDAPRFSDYAIEWRKPERQADFAAAERYWVDVLKSPPSPLDLPLDKPRPLEREMWAAREDRVIDRQLLGEVRTLAKRLNVSVVAVLLAAFDTLLHRLTGQSEFVIAMPMAGQALAGTYSLIGQCVNTVPLRLSIDPSAPFAAHATQVKTAILDASEYQQLSFGDLLRKVELARDPSRVPLASVLFNVDPEVERTPIGGATVSCRTNARVSDNFELYLNCTESPAGLELEGTFSTSLFEPSTVAAWLAEYEVLLRSIVADAQRPAQELEILPEAERRYLLEELNATALALPQVNTALEVIEQQVAKTPNAIAVRDAARAITYAELDRQANHLAHELRTLGVRDGDAVGVALARSAQLPVVLLAVWKCGAAYVPLDPEYPAERLEFIAKDAALAMLLEDPTSANVVPGADLKRLVLAGDTKERADAPTRSNDPSQLAYVIHTSGSTGKPKGVQVEHHSFVNMLASLQQWPGLAPSDVLVAVTTLSFDIAGLELFLPLSVGAQVVVAARETVVDGRALAALLEETAATVMQATPAGWRVLIESGFQGSSSFRAFTGGEALSADLAKALLDRTGEVWNLYGPTEATVWATGIRIESENDITIGRPFANSTVYILDALQRPVPRGARGELYLGGAPVARGYLNRPDLTAERFVPDPFGACGSRVMYRTGDVVRFDTQGRVVYEGRNDHQVKLRGFRIELGEIEASLVAWSAVRQAVVVVREFGPGDQRLVAYVVPEAGATVDLSSMQAQVRSKLPPYMVPQHVVVLEQLPLTPNGKIDRKALPAPGDTGAPQERYVAPRTQTETKLAQIWQEYLRVARVSVSDGFFELGGHSMLAVRMLSRIGESFGIELPIRSIFQAQTVEALALLVDARLVQARPSTVVEAGMEEIEF